MRSRWIFQVGIILGAAGVVAGFWMISDSGEERRKNIMKHLPSSSQMEQTKPWNGVQFQILKKAAETDENIARNLGK
ncbi:UQCC3 factor, partial [Polypterus senegalus]|nr:UQCC3 factor [Polypterus senegalus]